MPRPTARSLVGLGVSMSGNSAAVQSLRVSSPTTGARSSGGPPQRRGSEFPFARSTKIPHVDELPVWSVWCIKVRPGHRGKGIAHALLNGAVDYARSQGAPAVEGYPVDNRGDRVDLTMAYVGTRKLFEDAGFTKAADTKAVSGGFPRVVMRLDLR
jgi:ribosomal protein S18 acetylase RimI-like enzyme